MRRILAISVLSVMSLSVAANDVVSPVQRLGWLTGCWENRSGGRFTQEQWMAPAGGAIMGLNQSVVDGKTVAYEFLRIEERGGVLFLTAAPSGQNVATFEQIELTDSLVVFANPEHDFPQSISYTRLANGSILGQIQGQRGGQTRTIDFPLRRVPCVPGNRVIPESDPPGGRR